MLNDLGIIFKVMILFEVEGEVIGILVYWYVSGKKCVWVDF